MASAQLSGHDQAVLNCVFNPLLPLHEAYDEKPKLELKDKVENNPSEQTVLSKNLECKAIQFTENGSLHEAMNTINKAIEITPKRPSLYYNRARIREMLNNYEYAFTDLTQAITLASEHSDQYGGTLHQALCQRAMLYRKKEMVEEARADFTQAAEMGCEFAKRQLIDLNPYAALCNQMLRQLSNDHNFF